ncbi:tRNA (adenine-N1)-methyltransferase, partial [Candidatus Woesearchaeota archaeon]|nr:tRNA (adenine-N1)-methyltransferase [Candidatus Woesearchaeota archaeon]
LCCFLARIAKKVITYDIREDFIKVVEQNKKFLKLNNLIIKKKNIYEGIIEKNVDLITLDLPEPWKALDAVAKSLKHGGFLMSYSPTIPQVSDFVEAVKQHEHFVYLKTIEIIEREWELEERKIKPKSQPIGHSGFLTFVRRI